jgi:hypothetical protein
MRRLASGHRLSFCFVAVTAALCCFSVLAEGRQPPTDRPSDVVIRRDGLEPLVGQIISVEDAGVTIRTLPAGGRVGTSQLLPWDRVREVRQRLPHPNLEEYLAMAEQLWRARSRLERNDAALAEGLFEQLFERFRGQAHETALIVAEGLLRCRLERGANELAVLPALEVVRLRRAGLETDRFRMLVPIFDADYDLCPTLPPAWMDVRTTQTSTMNSSGGSHLLIRLDRELARYEAHDDEVVAAIAVLYQHALRNLHDVGQESGRVPADVRAAQRHAGVRLLRDIVTLTEREAAASDRRRAAETRLQRQIDDGHPWIEAWVRYFEGVSLLAGDEADGDRGVAVLAHLPARFDRSQPYLTNLALQRMAAHLEARGRTEQAASMRAELARRFPLRDDRVGARP